MFPSINCIWAAGIPVTVPEGVKPLQLRDLIIRMTAIDPESRPSLDEVHLLLIEAYRELLAEGASNRLIAAIFVGGLSKAAAGDGGDSHHSPVRSGLRRDSAAVAPLLQDQGTPESKSLPTEKVHRPEEEVRAPRSLTRACQQPKPPAATCPPVLHCHLSRENARMAACTSQTLVRWPPWPNSSA